MRFLVLFLCAVFSGTGNSQIASFVKPCLQRDAKCLRRSAQRALPIVAAGIPSLGMKSLDPMLMERVNTVEAGLKMDFKNTIVKGLRKCKVLDLRRFPFKTEIDLKCSVTLIGDYSIAGKLLILPIEGDGRYKIKIHDMVVKVVLNIDERVSDGERYWVVKDFDHTSDVLGWVKYNFQNLFNGNREYSDPVQEFANENWREIFYELAPPVIHAIVSQIVTETSKLFDKIPIRMLVL